MDLSTRESGSLEGGWWGTGWMRNSLLEKSVLEKFLPVPNFIPVVVLVQVMECSLVCMLGVIIAKLSTVQFWPAKSFLVPPCPPLGFVTRVPDALLSRLAFSFSWV